MIINQTQPQYTYIDEAVTLDSLDAATGAATGQDSSSLTPRVGKYTTSVRPLSLNLSSNVPQRADMKVTTQLPQEHLVQRHAAETSPALCRASATDEGRFYPALQRVQYTAGFGHSPKP